MKCRILGYTRLQGNSKKTGNPYDFYALSIAYQGEKGYVGQRVREISVDPVQVPGIEKLPVPITADILTDFSGRIASVNLT